MLVLYATIIDIMTTDVYEGGGIGGIDGGWRRPPKLFERSKRTFFFSRGGLFFSRLSPLSHLTRVWSPSLKSLQNLWSRLCCRWDRFKCPPPNTAAVSRARGGIGGINGGWRRPPKHFERSRADNIH